MVTSLFVQLNGRIRLEAIDVDIKATGGDSDRGNVVIDANEKVIVNAQVVDIKGKALG